MADVFAEANEIKRRRELMAQMLQQSQAAPIVGNTGIGQALAKLGTAYITGKANRELDQREQTNTAAYGQQMAGELGTFMKRYNGVPGEVMNDEQAASLMHGDQAPQLAEPVKADPKAAIFGAMTSRFPELQGMGKATLPGILKQDAAVEKPIEVNGQLVDPKTYQVRGDFRTKDEWEQIQVPDAQGKMIPAQRNKRTGQIDVLDKAAKVTATAQSSSNPIIAGPKAGIEAWSKNTGEEVAAAATAARAATKVLDTVSQMRALNATNLPSGPTAQPQIWLGSLAQSLGVPVDTAKLANAETFNSEATRAWAAMMGQMGGARGLVKEESEKIMQSLPALSQTQQGREYIMNTMQRAAQQQIKDAQLMGKQYSEALQSGDLSKYTYGLQETGIPRTQPIPAAPVAGTPSQPMSLDDYLKSKRGGN